MGQIVHGLDPDALAEGPRRSFKVVPHSLGTTTTDVRSGALAAVKLDEYDDTTGATYGQIAGAYYSVGVFPQEWRDCIHRGGEIAALAEQLVVANQHC